MEEYLLSQCKQNILEILQDENVEKHFPVNINFIELFENDTSLGNELLKDPDQALDELENWILQVQDTIIQESQNKKNLFFKENVHARVYGLPACPDLHRNVFPRVDDSGTFLQITGTVVKTKDPRMLEYQRPYQCSKCKHIQMVEASYDQKYIILPPKKCLNGEHCTGKNLINVGTLSAENCKDYQEIKIQEQTSNLNSTMPSTLWVTLEDDLVDSCKPGDDVTICGIVKRRWGPLVIGKKIDVELAFKANHIQVHNGNTVPTIITSEIREEFAAFWEKHEKSPLEGRDIILKSFCPKIYGMYLVKLAMAIVLAGGSGKYGTESGVQKRSESHILLVGDPGTGKSQLLRYSSKIIGRSVLTTGVGTTSAGLTVAAVMEDDGHWQLEAGALVLADGGICCIDEFNSMKPNDRASIHEAMEQQTISVAKAGIHCKLRTRCSIIAATNPKGGHLESFESLSLNLAIPSPLLSRFDVVLMLKDTYKHEWDSKVVKHILGVKSLTENKTDGSLWSLETLQQYFIFIKTINPSLSSKADQILAAYYQAQRQVSTRNKSRTTVRLLESLIRLSQGHAKLMCHQEVWVMDAIFAIIVIESSMHGECAVVLLDSLNILESFLEDPMKSYEELSTAILTKLGLQEILESEVDFIKTKCLVREPLQESEESLNISSIDQPIFTSTQCDARKIIIEFNGDEKTKVHRDNFETLNRSISNHVDMSNLSGKSRVREIKEKSFLANDKVTHTKITEIEQNSATLNNTGSNYVNLLNTSSKSAMKGIKDDKNQNITSNSNSFPTNVTLNKTEVYKRGNCANTLQNTRGRNCDDAGPANMLNLIKSVGDDFDLGFLNEMKDDILNKNYETLNSSSSNHNSRFNLSGKSTMREIKENTSNSSFLSTNDKVANNEIFEVNKENPKTLNSTGNNRVNLQNISPKSAVRGIKHVNNHMTSHSKSSPNLDKVKVYKPENCVDTPKNRKRKKCDDTETVNMFNLIKSVNDDFELDFLNEMNDDPIMESQNTKTKNFHKKFKFKRKEKFVMKQDSALKKDAGVVDNTRSNEITPLKESPKEYSFNFINESVTPQTSYIKESETIPREKSLKQHIFDSNNKQESEGVFNFISRTDNIKSSISSVIESKKIDRSKNSKMKDTESLRSRFGFVPKHPPPDIVPDNALENTNIKENIILSNSMFETEDQSLDFLNFDI